MQDPASNQASGTALCKVGSPAVPQSSRKQPLPSAWALGSRPHWKNRGALWGWCWAEGRPLSGKLRRARSCPAKVVAGSWKGTGHILFVALRGRREKPPLPRDGIPGLFCQGTGRKGEPSSIWVAFLNLCTARGGILRPRAPPSPFLVPRG